MSVVKNKIVSLVTASDVMVGDVFYSVVGSTVMEDPVQSVQDEVEDCGVLNVISNVNIVANQIAVSIRT